MNSPPQDPFETLPAWTRELGEIGVGATILTIRRFNIWRRDLETSCPPLAEVIESGVSVVANAAEPVSEELSEVLRGVEWLAPGQVRDAATATRRLTERLPDVLRLAGLTPRR